MNLKNKKIKNKKPTSKKGLAFAEACVPEWQAICSSVPVSSATSRTGLQLFMHAQVNISESHYCAPIWQQQ